MKAEGDFLGVILAGSRSRPDPVAEVAGTSVKVLAEIGGKPMLARVIDALRDAEKVGPILVVGDRETLTSDPDIRSREEALLWSEDLATPSLSLLSALAGRLEKQPVLITTGDHALLNREWVDFFLSEAQAKKVDLCAALADYDDLMAKLPESQRTALRFRDGRYSGCNLFALMTPAALQVITFWRKVEEARKTPWRIARALGWGLLFRYLLGRLTLDEAFAALQERTGAAAMPILMPDPIAAVDVDKPADLELARSLYARGQKS